MKRIFLKNYSKEVTNLERAEVITILDKLLSVLQQLFL